MFIVRNESKHSSGKVYRSVLLRQSYREDNKVKKRTILNLSSWSEEEINALDYALKNKKMLSPCNGNGLSLTQGRSIGSVYLLHAIAKRIGIVDALGNSFHAKLSLWLIIARILEQGSRLSATRLDSCYDIASILNLERGFDENNLYDTLHWLDDNQEKIEDSLFSKKSKTKKFYWYDVTSSYFEGVHNELAAFGYDRDKKKRKRIMVVGLLCQDNGDPVSIEAFKGNTQDTQTFENQLIKLKTRFGCESVTLICDRGIIREKQKQLLEKYGFHYITALPMRQITPLLKDRVVVPEEFTAELRSTIHKGRRYIYRRNPARALETKKQRDERFNTALGKVNGENAKIKERPKASLDTAKSRIQKYLNKLCIDEWAYVEIERRKLVLKMDKQALKIQSRFDGCYIWTTDLPESEVNDREVYEHYKDLKHIEEDFRSFKSTFLEIRPIHVRTEKSTRGHLLIVMLAHLIVRELRNAWEKFNLTVKEGLEELTLLCRQRIVFPRSSIECIPTPTPQMSLLLEAVNVKMPTTIPEVQVKVVTRRKVRKSASR